VRGLVEGERGGRGGLTKAVLVVVEGEVQVGVSLGGGVVVVRAVARRVVFEPGLRELMMPVLVGCGEGLGVIGYGGLSVGAGLDTGFGMFVALLGPGMG